VNVNDAKALIASAIPERGGTWADLGAGEGTFTRALAELLGPNGRLYAVDRDANALAALERETARTPNVIPVVADFSRPFDLPGLNGAQLDGMLFANALHFIRDVNEVLARLVTLLRSGGRVVFVEYDRRGPNPWVPYPIPAARLPALTSFAGLSTPTITATRASTYGGDLYVATAERVVVDG
jgi:ubiquinone/menaquinone biosynthesis C-methylase UbiE